MHRLVSLSAAVRPMTTADLDAVVTSARAFNESVGVTGLLIYAQQSFLQALEGDPEAVEAAFARVRASSRHRDLRESGLFTEPARRFPSWSLGFSVTAPHVVTASLLAPLVTAGAVSAEQAAGELLQRFSSATLPVAAR